MLACSRMWKVTCGSGMGLALAGELSDTCFYMLCEHSFLLSPSTRAKFGVKCYYRFKDDLFLGLENPSSTSRLAFFRELSTCAKFFKLEVGMPTHCGSTVPFVNFLDTSVGFGDRWSGLGRLDVLPFRKPSSRWRPLSHTSMHAPQIHSSLPIQHMRRFQCLSTSTSALRQFLSP